MTKILLKNWFSTYATTTQKNHKSVMRDQREQFFQKLVMKGKTTLSSNCEKRVVPTKYCFDEG